MRFQGVNHHRTCGVHLKLNGVHYDGRTRVNPGGEEGGNIHNSRDYSVGELCYVDNSLRVLSTETAEEMLLQYEGAAAVLLDEVGEG